LRIAMTCNGPGEFSGWVRPLVQKLHSLAPEVEAHCFFVPDDYATGEESAVARESLPMLRVHDPKAYRAFALGGRTQLGAFDAVLYLGGDVMHAARIHQRLGGALFAYRHAPRGFAKRVSRAFAFDQKNLEHLAKSMPRARVLITGNLAVDGAVSQVAEAFDGAERVIEEGVIFLPGSRKHEIEHLVPFFATAAARLRGLRPLVPVSFGLSPFTRIEALHAALSRPGDRRLYATLGRIVEGAEGPAILMEEAPDQPIPILRETLRAAVRSLFAITIPGTKCIELAALGVPAMVCIPFNIPERVVINGPLTYLDRLPGIGIPLKRAAVLAFASRFIHFAQPNMDAEAMVLPELAGTLTPGEVAYQAAGLIDDVARRNEMRERLLPIYRDHIGAAERMARALLESAAR
jgi:hypothetical protein